MDFNFSETNDAFLLLIRGQMTKCLDLCLSREDRDPVYGIFMGLCRGTFAVIDKNKRKELPEIIEFLKEIVKITHSRRYQNWSSWILNPVADSVSDDQAYNELCYSECSSLIGLFTLFAEKNIKGVVKATYYEHQAYKAYGNACSFLENKNNWINKNLEKEFKSRLKSISGLNKMLLYYAPGKLGKLFRVFRTTTELSEIEDEIESGFDLGEGLSLYLPLYILANHSVLVENFHGTGNSGWRLKRLIGKMESRYPQRNIFLSLMKASDHLQNGNFDEAIKEYDYILSSEDIPDAFKSIIHTFRIIGCIPLCKWREGLEHSKKAYKLARIMPGSMLLASAGFCKMIMVEENSNEFQKVMNECFRELPTVLRKICGFTFEALAGGLEPLYNSGKREFSDPILDISYFLNLFKWYKDEHFKPVLSRIEHNLSSTDGEDAKVDEMIAWNTFIKGVCYRHLKKYKESIDLFKKVLNNDNNNSGNSSQIYAAYELGLVYKEMGDYNEAKIWLLMAKNDFVDYIFKGTTKYRINEALKSMK